MAQSNFKIGDEVRDSTHGLGKVVKIVSGAAGLIVSVDFASRVIEYRTGGTYDITRLRLVEQIAQRSANRMSWMSFRQRVNGLRSMAGYEVVDEVLRKLDPFILQGGALNSVYSVPDLAEMSAEEAMEFFVQVLDGYEELDLIAHVLPGQMRRGLAVTTELGENRYNQTIYNTYIQRVRNPQSSSRVSVTNHSHRGNLVKMSMASASIRETVHARVNQQQGLRRTINSARFAQQQPNLVQTSPGTTAVGGQTTTNVTGSPNATQGAAVPTPGMVVQQQRAGVAGGRPAMRVSGSDTYRLRSGYEAMRLRLHVAGAGTDAYTAYRAAGGVANRAIQFTTDELSLLQQVSEASLVPTGRELHGAAQRRPLVVQRMIDDLVWDEARAQGGGYRNMPGGRTVSSNVLRGLVTVRDEDYNMIMNAIEAHRVTSRADSNTVRRLRVLSGKLAGLRKEHLDAAAGITTSYLDDILPDMSQLFRTTVTPGFIPGEGGMPIQEVVVNDNLYGQAVEHLVRRRTIATDQNEIRTIERQIIRLHEMREEELDLQAFVRESPDATSGLISPRAQRFFDQHRDLFERGVSDDARAGMEIIFSEIERGAQVELAGLLGGNATPELVGIAFHQDRGLAARAVAQRERRIAEIEAIRPANRSAAVRNELDTLKREVAFLKRPIADHMQNLSREERRAAGNAMRRMNFSFSMRGADRDLVANYGFTTTDNLPANVGEIDQEAIDARRTQRAVHRAVGQDVDRELARQANQRRGTTLAGMQRDVEEFLRDAKARIELPRVTEIRVGRPQASVEATRQSLQTAAKKAQTALRYRRGLEYYLQQGALPNVRIDGGGVRAGSWDDVGRGVLDRQLFSGDYADDLVLTTDALAIASDTSASVEDLIGTTESLLGLDYDIRGFDDDVALTPEAERARKAIQNYRGLARDLQVDLENIRGEFGSSGFDDTLEYARRMRELSRNARAIERKNVLSQPIHTTTGDFKIEQITQMLNTKIGDDLSAAFGEGTDAYSEGFMTYAEELENVLVEGISNGDVVSIEAAHEEAMRRTRNLSGKIVARAKGSAGGMTGQRVRNELDYWNEYKRQFSQVRASVYGSMTDAERSVLDRIGGYEENLDIVRRRFIEEVEALRERGVTKVPSAITSAYEKIFNNLGVSERTAARFNAETAAADAADATDGVESEANVVAETLGGVDEADTAGDDGESVAEDGGSDSDDTGPDDIQPDGDDEVLDQVGGAPAGDQIDGDDAFDRARAQLGDVESIAEDVAFGGVSAQTHQTMLNDMLNDIIDAGGRSGVEKAGGILPTVMIGGIEHTIDDVKRIEGQPVVYAVNPQTGEVFPATLSGEALVPASEAGPMTRFTVPKVLRGEIALPDQIEAFRPVIAGEQLQLVGENGLGVTERSLQNMRRLLSEGGTAVGLDIETLEYDGGRRRAIYQVGQESVVYGPGGQITSTEGAFDTAIKLNEAAEQEAWRVTRGGGATGSEKFLRKGLGAESLAELEEAIRKLQAEGRTDLANVLEKAMSSDYVIVQGSDVMRELRHAGVDTSVFDDRLINLLDITTAKGRLRGLEDMVGAVPHQASGDVSAMMRRGMQFAAEGIPGEPATVQSEAPLLFDPNFGRIYQVDRAYRGEDESVALLTETMPAPGRTAATTPIVERRPDETMLLNRLRTRYIPVASVDEALTLQRSFVEDHVRRRFRRDNPRYLLQDAEISRLIDLEYATSNAEEVLAGVPPASIGQVSHREIVNRVIERQRQEVQSITDMLASGTGDQEELLRRGQRAERMLDRLVEGYQTSADDYSLQEQFFKQREWHRQVFPEMRGLYERIEQSVNDPFGMSQDEASAAVGEYWEQLRASGAVNVERRTARNALEKHYEARVNLASSEADTALTTAREALASAEQALFEQQQIVGGGGVGDIGTARRRVRDAESTFRRVERQYNQLNPNITLRYHSQEALQRSVEDAAVRVANASRDVVGDRSGAVAPQPGGTAPPTATAMTASEARDRIYQQLGEQLGTDGTVAGIYAGLQGRELDFYDELSMGALNSGTGSPLRTVTQEFQRTLFRPDGTLSDEGVQAIVTQGRHRVLFNQVRELTDQAMAATGSDQERLLGEAESRWLNMRRSAATGNVALRRAHMALSREFGWDPIFGADPLVERTRARLSGVTGTDEESMRARLNEALGAVPIAPRAPTSTTTTPLTGGQPPPPVLPPTTSPTWQRSALLTSSVIPNAVQFRAGGAITNAVAGAVSGAVPIVGAVGASTLLGATLFGGILGLIRPRISTPESEEAMRTTLLTMGGHTKHDVQPDMDYPHTPMRVDVRISGVNTSGQHSQILSDMVKRVIDAHSGVQYTDSSSYRDERKQIGKLRINELNKQSY